MLQLYPRSFTRLDELRLGLQPGDALECDAKEGGVVAHQPAHDPRADGDEVAGGVIGLRQLVDVVVKQLERGLRQSRHQTILGTEEAVDGACRSTRRISDASHRQGVGASVGHEFLGRGAQSRSRLRVVLFRSAHGLTA